MAFSVSSLGKVKHKRKIISEVVSYLRDHREPQPFAKLASAVQATLAEDVIKSLEENPKVEKCEGNCLKYKPTIPGLSGLEDLKKYIREHTTGTVRTELADAYIGVEKDIAQLLETNEFVGIINTEDKNEVIFAVDPTASVPIDDDVKAMWLKVEIDLSAAR